jgi:hypothetical protein
MAGRGPRSKDLPSSPGPTTSNLAGPERLRSLLRQIFAAAGGDRDDWNSYDRVVVERRRAAVITRPDRIYSKAR